MTSPRVAGAEEGSRDLTVLATSGAEENPATTRALQPQETRLTVRYVSLICVFYVSTRAQEVTLSVLSRAIDPPLSNSNQADFNLTLTRQS